MSEPTAPERVARMFHETYERLAPYFGYATRPDTRAFDPGSLNGRLMIAVCAEVLSGFVPADLSAQREREAFEAGMLAGGDAGFVDAAFAAWRARKGER